MKQKWLALEQVIRLNIDTQTLTYIHIQRHTYIYKWTPTLIYKVHTKTNTKSKQTSINQLK